MEEEDGDAMLALVLESAESGDIGEPERRQRQQILAELKEGLWSRVMPLQPTDGLGQLNEETNEEDQVARYKRIFSTGNQEREKRRTVLRERLKIMLDLCTAVSVPSPPLQSPQADPVD